MFLATFVFVVVVFFLTVLEEEAAFDVVFFDVCALRAEV